MKHSFTLLTAAVVIFISPALSAQNNFWSFQSEGASRAKQSRKLTLPKQFAVVRLDTANFLRAVRSAPKEFTAAARNNPFVVTLPMPDKTFKRFTLVETPAMEPALASKFPEIKTYGGKGIDDPSATIKADWTSFGLHVIILSPESGTVIIDPYMQANSAEYISYEKKDVEKIEPFIEYGVMVNETAIKRSLAQRTAGVSCIGETLRTYRLALACTAEYAKAVGGTQPTVAQVLSAIVTTINRVDAVYESELGIRMVLTANNDKIIFTNTATQPFTGNNNALVLINESQKVIDSIIGSTHYDIGHTFSTGAGGYAGVGVVCENGTKATGVTGSANPTGDSYNIDYVAHEIGHQFGANHTFNAATGNCGGGNAKQGTNAEPGSGVTIMGYAGICYAVNNLEPHTIPYFHAVSLDEITRFINSSPAGNCAVLTPTGNLAPVVNAGKDYVIPTSTPFVLTGSAYDQNGDPLTYSWEQINVNGPFGDWNRPAGDAPIFRSFAPVSSPVRYFPKMSDAANNTTTIGEILPSYERTLKFRLTARDNHSAGGGVCSAEMNLLVSGNGGPFVVTSPNTAATWTAGSFTTVKWDVAKTDVAPINCTTVSIELSVDGGVTFPVVLVANTANDGEEEIIVPNNVTTAARVRVKAVGNIFFDISNENFTITANTKNTFTLNNPSFVNECSRSNASTVIKTNAVNAFSNAITLSATGNPAGTSVIFGTNPLTPGQTTTVALQGNIPAGIHNVTIKGTADSVVQTVVIRFLIGTPTTAPVIASPSNNSIGYLLTPAFTWNTAPERLYYKLQISTSSDFSTIAQGIDSIVGSNYTLSKALAANTEYFWRVTPYNACGAGPASTAFRFKTDAIVCNDPVSSSDVPLKIDTVPNTITSKLDVATNGTIQDVDVVGLKGKHSFVSDITVTLISPSNTRVILLSESCYGGVNFNLNFDDQSPNNLQCPLDNNQVAKPQKQLSAFNNENSAGRWQLQVDDPYNKDGGSLDNWGLRICTYQPSLLPVNWLTFTAVKDHDKQVMLLWSTANESGNSFYVIEKSSDGITYSAIGKINAGNSPSALQQYYFNDLKPTGGESYYRLQQVDKDGKISYSKIVKVYFDRPRRNYDVYPNPAVDKSTIKMLADVKQVSIRVADASGKVFYHINGNSVKAGQQYLIPVRGLGKGLYILTVTTENGTSNEKIIVQ